jgi:hypothetical protein
MSGPVYTDQGNPLLSELASSRSVRAIGQKYRIVYRVQLQSQP